MKEDVTSQVEFQNNDDESLPITRCVCGEKFSAWYRTLSIYEEGPWECPKCGVRLMFSCGITVYRIT